MSLLFFALCDFSFLSAQLHTVTAEDVDASDPYRFCLRTPGQAYMFSSSEKSAWLQLVTDAAAQLAVRPAASELSELDKSSHIDVSSAPSMTREQLVALILEWSRSDDAEAVLLEVKELAASLADAFQDDEDVTALARPQHLKQEVRVDDGNAKVDAVVQQPRSEPNP